MDAVALQHIKKSYTSYSSEIVLTGQTRQSRTRQVLRDLSVCFPIGQLTVIVGRSGCGKSTLLKLLAGKEQPDAGQIEMPQGWHSALLSPDPYVITWTNVQRNVAMACGVGKTPQERYEKAADFVRLVGLQDFADLTPAELSTGMKQRLGLARVLAVDADNRVVRRLGKPESASLSEEAVFKPSKVAVNASGAVFVAASGIYLGLLQYGTDDVFANFFGAAKVEVTPDVVLAAMWKSLFTDAQRESLKREISTEYANLFIDSEDFVFTVTSTVNEKQVSRLNAAGENILKYPGYDDASLFTSGYNRNNFGDQEFDYSKGYKIVSQLTDLHVDAEGILTVLDSRRGKVLQFDSELNPIGVFGGTGDQRGFFRGAAALEKQGEAYLIADGDKNTITRMVPTGYIRTVREALAGYRQGEYARSEELWNEVLASNPHFTVAYRSIGRALLADGDCRAAMEYLREGDDRYYYSLALQEYRRDFIRNNLLWLLPAMLAVLAGLVVGWRRLKRWLQS